jgi:natural product biosynthesis luciferase-like monooxygenase protein
VTQPHVRLRVVLTGSQSLLIHCGEALRRRGHDIALVVTFEDAVRSWAEGSGLVLAASHTAVQSVGDFDCLFSIGNLEVIPAAVLKLASLGAFNFHDGPLPRYAGLHATAWALLSEEPQHGVRWHRMEAKVDTGAIVAERDFPVAPGTSSFGLNGACFEAGISSFSDLLEGLETGQLTPRDQDASQRTYFGRRQRPQGAGVLRFDHPAASIVSRARALDFGPVQNPLCLPKLWTGRRLLVIGRVDAGPETAAAAGTLAVSGERLQVAAAQGSVWLEGLRDARGVAVTAADAASEIGPRAPALSEPAADDLRRRLEDTSGSEPYWRARLADLRPLDRHAAEGGAYRTGEERAQHSASWSVPEDASAGQRALALQVLTFLARRAGRDVFDVAVDMGTDNGPLFLQRGIVRAELGATIPFRTALDAAGTAFDEARAHGPIAMDLIHRTPSLGFGLLAALDTFVIHLGSGPAPGHRGQAVLVSPGGDGLSWYAEDAASARQLGALFETFRAAALSAPETPLGDIPLRSNPGPHAMAGPSCELPDESFYPAFARQAADSPELMAVTDGAQTLTYAQLLARADAQAVRLRQLGVGPDVLVGIYVNRGVDLVVAVLAVLGSGAAFLPLDPGYPAARLRFLIEDAGCRTVVTTSALRWRCPAAEGSLLVCIDREGAKGTRPEAAGARQLAYMMYTSGSTGRPKGVLVEHGNLSNFLLAMDARVPRPRDAQPTWLALTSLNFDICVLELLWTLARGFAVVVHTDQADGRQGHDGRPIDFSLMFFASDEGATDVAADKYRLLLESAKFGDRNGFCAVWTPERHFHAFGGLYPNPSVASAAIAAVTQNIGIRAGSVVAPLHSPIRIAEEWALVDNLSGGRVGVSFAAGWQPQDFVLAPEKFEGRKQAMFDTIATVQRLWRGDALAFEGPGGEMTTIQTLPRPVQAELPVWVTAASNPETFAAAGSSGANLLTHLLGQSLRELGDKVAIYREAWAAAGHAGRGVVTLMLHTFVGTDDDEVRERVRAPMKAYLDSAVELIARAAWSFPTFRKAADAAGRTPGETFEARGLSAEEREALLEASFERYFATSGLFGAPETCLRMVDRVRDADVDEIACLLDYGLPADEVLGSLKQLNGLRAAACAPEMTAPASSVAQRIVQHGVTHMQCTPSQMTLLLADPATEPALEQLDALLLGGEALPPNLAERVSALPGQVLNMYGPTETTIWSSTAPVEGPAVRLGAPVANTTFHVLDAWMNPVDNGTAGHLWIGGKGVARGYHKRPEETAARFVVHQGQRIYDTGDLVRVEPDGSLSFLGRADLQVKLRGHRIELGEIEAQLASLPGVAEAAVTITSGASAVLVAYARPDSPGVSSDDLLDALRRRLPGPMVPAAVVLLDTMPRTANGKLDRRALPAAQSRRGKARGAAPTTEIERQLAASWRSLLNVEDVGLHDNFFDLGGHSLLAVQLHRDLEAETQWGLSLTDLFRFPTIGSLAAFIASDRAGPSLDPSQERAEARRASMARRRRR